jgi:membrane carboxypeptidase/penicillin-binding protein PbpC
LTAFTRGLSPANLVWDIPSQNQEANSEYQYHGPLRMRTAMANDYLLPMEQVITQVGLDNVWKTIQQLGLASGEAALHNSGELVDNVPLTLLELSQAYGILATQGILAGMLADDENGSNGATNMEPITILEVKDTLAHLRPDATQLEGTILSQRPVINPQLAYLVTDVLSDETARWPSLGHPNPLEIGRPVAAKIGRTSSGKDAWTVGYMPERVVAVWMGTGADDANLNNLPRQSAALWHALMQYSLRDLPSQEWSVPPGINRLNVCNPSGLLPSADCPDVVSEVFLAGTEPTQTDSLYRTFQINRETGRLATAFTPPDLIEERVYLIVPPEAETWARLSGLPTPPEEYDVILAPRDQSTNAQITSPAMLANVSDIVEIIGSAQGEDFAFYRLQVGKGLNPRTWLQIGEDVNQPIDQGLLGSWDTQGLDGLHTIQLLVVQTDQTVNSAVIQVTADNVPPEVSILSPSAGEEVTPRSGQITFLVDAQDNLDIQQVDFYLDGKRLETLYYSPFAIPWQSQPGKHVLRAVASDRAGNESEATSEFSVSP